jgi:hypothetical protein
VLEGARDNSHVAESVGRRKHEAGQKDGVAGTSRDKPRSPSELLCFSS